MQAACMNNPQPFPHTPSFLLDVVLAIPRFLRNPKTYYAEVQQNVELPQKVLRFTLAALLFLATYGFITGTSHGFLQAVASAIKMPLLFVMTMAFCLPALYFFSLAVLGTQLTLLQMLTVVLVGIGVTAFLLLGLAPVTFFFVLTSSNYAFFQLIAVAFVAVSGYVGLYFLWDGMTFIDTTHQQTVQPIGRWILRAWTLLYGFVGSQMAWRLSPMIGDPEQPFILLQPSRDNFYIDVANAVQRTIGGNSSMVSLFVIFGMVMIALVGTLLLTNSPKLQPNSSPTNVEGPKPGIKELSQVEA
jgi:hypothetical protein